MWSISNHLCSIVVALMLLCLSQEYCWFVRSHHPRTCLIRNLLCYPFDWWSCVVVGIQFQYFIYFYQKITFDFFIKPILKFLIPHWFKCKKNSRMLIGTCTLNNDWRPSIGMVCLECIWFIFNLYFVHYLIAGGIESRRRGCHMPQLFSDY